MPLHPQAAAHLAATAGHPPVHTLTVAQARSAGRGYLDLQRPAPDVAFVHHTYIVGPGSSLPVRVYRDGPPGGPVILMLHGSGFVIADIEISDEPARILARDTGATVVTVDYRKSPENPYPAAIDDAGAALDWIASGGVDVDPTRIAVVGDSAGGTLTASLVQRTRDRSGPPIAAQALLYPTLRRRAPDTTLAPSEVSLSALDVRWFWDHYLGAATSPTGAEPLESSDFRDLPPAFVATAEYDVLRADGAEYADRLRAAGGDVELREYPGVPHGFYWMDAVLDTAGDLHRDLAAWLTLHLNGRS